MTSAAGQVGDLEMKLEAGSASALTGTRRYGSIDYRVSTDAIRSVFDYLLLEHLETVSPAHLVFVNP